MLRQDLLDEVLLAKSMLYDNLPEPVKRERPWLLQVTENILLVVSTRHLLKSGLYYRDTKEMLLYIARTRFAFSPEESTLESNLHLVEQQRFRQTQAMMKISKTYPSLYEWLQSPASMATFALLWHANDPVFRRM